MRPVRKDLESLVLKVCRKSLGKIKSRGDLEVLILSEKGSGIDQPLSSFRTSPAILCVF